MAGNRTKVSDAAKLRKYIETELNPGPARDWLLKSPERAYNFQSICKTYQRKRYELNCSNGFLIKNNVPRDDRGVLPTDLNLVFTTNSDLHLHSDVNEIVYPICGEGWLYLFDNFNQKFKKCQLTDGSRQTIRAGIPHCFETNEYNPLEIRLRCNGIWERENEIVLKRFDKWDSKRLVDEGL